MRIKFNALQRWRAFFCLISTAYQIFQKCDPLSDNKKNLNLIYGYDTEVKKLKSIWDETFNYLNFGKFMVFLATITSRGLEWCGSSNHSDRLFRVKTK